MAIPHCGNRERFYLLLKFGDAGQEGLAFSAKPCQLLQVGHARTARTRAVELVMATRAQHAATGHGYVVMAIGVPAASTATARTFSRTLPLLSIFFIFGFSGEIVESGAGSNSSTSGPRRSLTVSAVALSGFHDQVQHCCSCGDCHEG